MKKYGSKRNTTLGILNVVGAVATGVVTALLIINSISHMKRNKEKNVSK